VFEPDLVHARGTSNVGVMVSADVTV
jgi:hypothetical protein